MIAFAWAAFGVLALLWTAGAAVTAALAGWAAQAIASGAAASAGRELAAAPLPQWMAIWVDPAFVAAAQSALLAAVDAVSGWLPLAGSAAGWLVPTVWVLWALGLLALLVGAIVTHLLVRRLRPRRA